MAEVDWDAIYQSLEELWDGPFDVVRAGNFDMAASHKIQETLSSINVPILESLPRRFVSEIWFIPIFLEWQKEKVRTVNPEAIVQEYNNLCSWTFTKVNELIGA